MRSYYARRTAAQQPSLTPMRLVTDLLEDLCSTLLNRIPGRMSWIDQSPTVKGSLIRWQKSLDIMAGSMACRAS